MIDVFYYNGKRTETAYRMFDETQHVPTDVFENQYVYKGTDKQATLDNITERWSYGGDTSYNFIKQTCKDCDEEFTRKHNAAMHEHQTGHEIYERKRELSVGDIVSKDGKAYLIHPSGMKRQKQLDPAMRNND